MGANESTLVPPLTSQAGRQSRPPSYSQVLEHGRPVHLLLNPSSSLPPDPESPFYTALFDDFTLLYFASARPLATLIELSLGNPKEQHAIALVYALRAAVHRLRSGQGQVLLGALIFSRSALTELMRMAPSEDALCLTLGAGHAESSLQEADRIDLGKSLVARILTASLDVLAEHQGTDHSSNIKLYAIELTLVALSDELYNPAHAHQPLSTLLDRHPHPAKIIHVLLDVLSDTAAYADVENHLKIGFEHIASVQRMFPGSAAAARLSRSGALFAASTSVANIQTSVNNALSALSSRISLPPFVGGINTFPDAALEAHVAHFMPNHVPTLSSGHSTAVQPRTPSSSQSRMQSSSRTSFVSEYRESNPETVSSTTNNAIEEVYHGSSYMDDGITRSPRSPPLSNKSPRRSARGEKSKLGAPYPLEPSHLAEQALSLLVILCGPRPSGQYRTALSELTDSTRELREERNSYSFPQLYETLGKWVAHPKAALLGYYLITGNKRFRTFALARTDPDVLLLPLLASLRRRCVVGAVPADAHISAAIILILTSDKGFCEAIDSISVPSSFIPFLEDTARIGNEKIVLSGMILLICARAVQQSLVMRRRVPDCFLASTTLAIMGNVSGYVTNLHSLAAERLLSLVEFLGRRRRKALMLEYQKSNMPKRPPRLGDSPRASGKAPDDFETNKGTGKAKSGGVYRCDPKLSELVMEYLGVALEVIVSILRSRSVVSANRHLVYTLLHRESIVYVDHIAKISDHTRALCHMLRRMLEFFIELVEDHSESSHDSRTGRPRRNQPLGASSTGISVERVFRIIDKKARHLGTDTFEGLPEARFTYEEFELAKVFLRPYSWSLVTRSCELFWDLDKASMPISLAPFVPAG
ncbi:Dymeclin [Gracilariopsis chorda]|uniref:Dymeclin n=1 Tax=Gracilariopsis chorda TaxID=448386 RepID=A0A2V3IUX0_9FLOR|nr:Dymeclin [Gracilariopsis chorda]|eukprot:PXF45913.1 Dymeclin [Gracilariopsis chorda]